MRGEVLKNKGRNPSPFGRGDDVATVRPPAPSYPEPLPEWAGNPLMPV
jgi:hypothetical protein